jgi:hypothetical protein
MRKGMGIAIRILIESVVTGQGYSDPGGQRYSSVSGSVVRIRPALDAVSAMEKRGGVNER